VLIIEIDDVETEPAQARLAALPHVVRPAVHAEEAAVGAAHVAELRRNDDVGAAAGERAPYELLVGADAIDVGRIEKVDAEVERATDRRDRLGLVAAAVEIGHSHAAETERRHLEPRTELPLVHDASACPGCDCGSRGTVPTLCPHRCDPTRA
jgi:hypothetical protein